MLALLALALFPVVAHAECTSSSCITYETEVPSVGSHPAESQKSTNHKVTKPSNNEKAEGSANPPSRSSEEPEGGSSEESGGEGHKSTGGASSGGNNNPPKGGGGGGEHASKATGGKGAGQSGGNVSKAEKVPVPASSQGKQASESTGGSSPVVPILIAVVVLAAISIGVVLYRQRSSGQGPDRRASSPNAG